MADKRMYIDELAEEAKSGNMKDLYSQGIGWQA